MNLYDINNKVVMIGNSPSVLEKENGALIDSFDVIVRSNNFVIGGFEKYIGSKTDIWVTNGGPKIKRRNLSDFKDIIICAPDFDRTVEGVTHYIPKHIIDDIFYLFRIFYGNNTHKYPTSGLISAIYLASIYNKCYVYGLNGLNNIEHYYDKSQLMDLHAHSPEIENLVFNHYISKNILFQL